MNMQRNAKGTHTVPNGGKEKEEDRRISADIFLFVDGSETEIIAERTVYRHDVGKKSFISLSHMQKKECSFMFSYLHMSDKRFAICRADRQILFLSNTAMTAAGLCLGVLVPVRVATFPEMISAASQSFYQFACLSPSVEHGFHMPVMPMPENKHIRIIDEIYSFFCAYSDTDFAYRADIRGSLSATAYLRRDLARIANFVDVLLVDRSNLPTGTRIFTRDAKQKRVIDFSFLKVFSTALMMHLRDRLKGKTLEMELSTQDGLLCITFSGTLLRSAPPCVPEDDRFFQYFFGVAERHREQILVNIDSRYLSITLIPYRYNETSIGELCADVSDIFNVNDLQNEE